MPSTPSSSDLREELRSYYGPLLPFWDATLAERGDLAFWRRRAEGWSGRTVLELGCGTGRVSEVLAARGARVVGLDLNLEALRRARGRLGPDAALIGADMRRFALGRRFPAAVAANDPFSHLRSDEGRRRAMEAVAAHLEPDGVLVLDALWFSDAWLAEARSEGGKVFERAVAADGAGPELRIRQRWRCEPTSRRCTARYELRADGEPRGTTTFRGRAWSIPELYARLAASGLRPRLLHGDYGGGRWHPSAERLIVEAVRR